MKNPWLWLVAGVCAIVASSFLAYPMLKYQALRELQPTPVMEAAVTIRHGYSSGSGVHIGDGYILTANHVISGATAIRVEYSGGGFAAKAEVLWANKEYDIALLRVDRPRWEQAAPLDCSPNYVGQRVTAVGNPMGAVLAYTRIEVVGAPRKIGPWAWATPVNGAVIPGQSGGGVVNDQGQTVGIAVGVLNAPYGMAAFGWIVPAETVCKLMARA